MNGYLWDSWPFYKISDTQLLVETQGCPIEDTVFDPLRLIPLKRIAAGKYRYESCGIIIALYF
jgi:hypothetical protein